MASNDTVRACSDPWAFGEGGIPEISLGAACRDRPGCDRDGLARGRGRHQSRRRSMHGSALAIAGMVGDRGGEDLLGSLGLRVFG